MRSLRSARLRSAVVVSALVGGLVTVGGVTAPSAVAAPGPIVQRPATVATTDVLPTVQIDGVAWSQAIVGNNVYVAGSFATATPAASEPDQTVVARSNFLAYDITTGRLDVRVDTALNAQAIVVAASPDKTRLYIGGDFTTANGSTHRRLVAVDVATGAVIESFKPNLDARVASIVATDDTVYVGGNLTNANGVARTRLAAFSATTGSLLGWAPTASGSVKAMTLTPDGSKLIVGGQFQTVNGVNVYGLAAVSPIDGALVPWAASGQVRAYGATSAITSLRTDGVSILGTGYTYGALPVSGTREFEGTFSADPTTGALNWLQDCHGDSYDVYSTGQVVYSVSHAHFCANIGGFPQTVPGENRRALAFTAGATGTIATNTQSGYKNWAGTPSPGLYNWFPDLEVGEVTGQSQAAWTIVGSGPYIAVGGEFPTVNGVPQRGLVRFATQPVAVGTDGPRAQGSNLLAVVSSLSPETARVRFQTGWDRDDMNLTYTVVRNSNRSAPVYTTTVASTWWNRPFVTFVDTGLTPGATYTYRVYSNDPNGNQVQGDLATVTVAAAGSAYQNRVLADGASLYHRLGETGADVLDYAGTADALAAAGVTRGVPGALAGDADTASRFSGTSTGLVAGPATTVTAAGNFTVEGWVRTTSQAGGEILGLGNKSTGSSTSTDRVLYLDNAGHAVFGVNNGSPRTLTSTGVVNDGAWHHVAATLGDSGMSLYVDGYRVGTRDDVFSATGQTGFWRIGGDSLSSWSPRPTSGYLAGDIDDVAVYPAALSAQAVAAHAVAGGRSVTLPAAPSDTYGATVFADNPELFWRLGESGTTAAAVDSSPIGASGGTYQGVVTKAQNGAIVGGTDTAVRFNGVDGFAATTLAANNPVRFSVEAWVRTTSTVGGRIIGFGNQRTQASTQADRQMYMANSGRIVFAVGSASTLTSTAAYNDGGWHHVVGTNGPNGMVLYIDGQQVGTRASATPLTITAGWWRAGGDLTGGSTSRFLSGTLDEVAVYHRALDAATVLRHYQVGTDTTPNTPPVAAFDAVATDLSVSTNAAASTDPDGSVGAYRWAWGDGSEVTAASTATAQHVYAAAGTYTVGLTVTDNRGATTSVTRQVVVLGPNQAPVVGFTSTVSGTDAVADGSTSTDPDGSVVDWSWNWGDGSAADSGPVATHRFLATGTYQVTLTVTDDRGGRTAVTQPVSVVAPNQAPVAAFTRSVNLRTVTMDGSSSTDSDGSVAGYTWNWGDGSADSTGVTAAHTYAADGTYPVTLVVTDETGASSPVVASTVTVSRAVVTDGFARTTTSGWGDAEMGGTWVPTGSTSSKFSVSGGVGRIALSTAGSGYTNNLNGVSVQDLDGVVDFAVDKAATGGGVYTTVAIRRVGTSSYQFTLKYLAGGGVNVAVARVLDGSTLSLGNVTLMGVSYVAGDAFRMRFQAIGTGTTTLAVKAWKVGTAEPATFALTRTDSSAALQFGGALSLQTYLSGSATNAPLVATVDNIGITAP